MIDNLFRSTSNPNFEISIPSILMIPSQISTNRNKATTKELLPDPVRPTIPEIIHGHSIPYVRKYVLAYIYKYYIHSLPIFSPAFMLKDTSISTSGSSSLYLNCTALNSIFPREGQSSAGLRATVLLAPSLCKV